MKRYCKIFSLVAGAMDACTGAFLMISPTRVLSLLLIPAPSAEATVFVSWIGAFVFSVGLSYGFTARGGQAAETVWKITGLIRGVVAVFLVSEVASGVLSPGWAVVALTDAVVAAIQIFGLYRQWWREGPQ